jgi:hypothetical protein
VPAERRLALPGIIVHRARRLDEADLRPIQGIPATAPARTIIDLASVYDRGRLSDILDEAAARRLLSRRDLVDALARVAARRTESGLIVIRDLLAERPSDRRPLGSALERRLLEAIRRAGLPEPATQRRVVLPSGEIRYFDYTWDDILLGVELITFRWHGDLKSWAEDAERETELVAVGWAVLRTTSFRVMYHLDEVVAQIARALAARGVVPGTATLQRRGASQAV